MFCQSPISACAKRQRRPTSSESSRRERDSNSSRRNGIHTLPSPHCISGGVWRSQKLQPNGSMAVCRGRCSLSSSILQKIVTYESRSGKICVKKNQEFLFQKIFVSRVSRHHHEKARNWAVGFYAGKNRRVPLALGHNLLLLARIVFYFLPIQHAFLVISNQELTYSPVVILLQTKFASQ